MEYKTCINCQRRFSRKPSELKRCKCCNVTCRKELTKKQRKTQCRSCKKIFYPKKRKNRKDPQFCSQVCMGSEYATLDYSTSHLNQTLEIIDGFMLGDGHISCQYPHVAWSLKYKEFNDYIERLLSAYDPTSRYSYFKDKRLKNGGTYQWKGRTKCHPDIKLQRARWYPDDKKIVPDNVILSPLSVMIWYLGDGCLNSYNVELCTDSFSKAHVYRLSSMLGKLGIENRRSKRNRIYISSAGRRSLFKFIGNKSPIKCYDYKFNSV